MMIWIGSTSWRVKMSRHISAIANYYYYYYYAAFNAPCVGHKDDESQAQKLE